ncbi:10526_t:CDS:10 [Paraglomus brasilianum]|uniref:10526_t:CDS:1 n=1 Tax=Paraglomus brasilianum TaxID=144538 RepID=A0A9N9F717_9GLOM|nr:10526_t:CDS:10 [Paraglomus brasilianum]
MAAPTEHNPDETTLNRKEATPACAKCGLLIIGHFVRALGGTYHLECFKCQDCGEIVASKFFPMDSHDGKQLPLCERDYFRRLNLICAQCGEALRSSYITALDRKYHIEHFTCSVCPTVFGPQDSYYEHEGKVYCHYHYSTQFAVKCTGCQTAILKQFVEINRNLVDEHWHPECYMIHKFWNVKLASPPVSKPYELSKDQADTAYAEKLKQEQKSTEEKVYHIWTVLSAFEESSAACISDMLLRVSNGSYIEGVKIAEKFIMHVEILFKAIDKLEVELFKAMGQGLQHNREAKMLCKKIVNFFSLLSHTQETGVRRLGITQELLSLVTGLAHYLKLLIRIALTGALKLERDFMSTTSISFFLATLAEISTKAHTIPIIDTSPTSDLCNACRVTVEEECYKYEQFRYHIACFRCGRCKADLARAENKLSIKNQYGDKKGDDGRELNDAYFDLMAEMALCPSCKTERAARGFKKVTKLEQYTYLLRVALSRLYTSLNRRDEHSLSDYDGEPRGRRSEKESVSSLGRKDSRSKSYSSGDRHDQSINLRRLKSVQLDRKLSTSARRAKRSTIIEQESNSSDSTLVNARSKNLARAPSQRRVQIIEDMDEFQAKDSLVQFDNRNEAITLDDISAIAIAVDEEKKNKRLMPRTKCYLSELSALEYVIVKHVAVVVMEQYLKDYFTLEELLDLIGVRRTNFWTKFVTTIKSSEKKNIKKKGTFGVPLDMLVERNGVDSVLGAGPGCIRIPSFVDDGISAMRRMDMSVEGIFRKNGNIRRLKDLSDAIDKNPSSVNLAEDNPVQVAALLKKFLRDLPDPLLTFKLQRLFITSQRLADSQARKKILHLTCCLLPKVNRDTMEVLFSFFKWVASFSHVDEETGSKMDLHNLATVITPNVLYSKSKDPSKDDSFLAIEAVHSLLKYQDDFCLVPEDLAAILNDQELFNNPEGLTTKDILKKCENFVRMNSQPADSVPRMTSQQYRSQMHNPSPRIAQHHTAQNEEDLEDYAVITHPSEMQATEFETRDSSNGSIYSLVNESSIPVEQRAS